MATHQPGANPTLTGRAADALGAGGPGSGRVPVGAEPVRPGESAALAAFAVGLAYASISVYWGAGGRWLLDTVGKSLATGHASGAAVVAVWGAVALKTIAALLPLLVCQQSLTPAWHRRALVLSFIEGVLLTAYGFVLTAVGLLVQAGLVSASAHADHKALAWHAFLWDPWFLVWGLLVLTALRLAARGRRRERRPVARA